MNNMSMNNTSIKLSVVVFKDGAHWIAQGLQYDIAAQSKKLVDLPNLFNNTLLNHMLARSENDQEPFRAVPRAPDEYWEMFNDGIGLSLKQNGVAIPASNFLPPFSPPTCDARIMA